MRFWERLFCHAHPASVHHSLHFVHEHQEDLRESKKLLDGRERDRL
jgi:hypothetical protein